ncbi:CAP domain-containing protein [Sphingomonas sp. MS122]|uniref:CAP domain-containing protein n=1 Tax=Sphingomonas sp. MS122 TaxID=3412683 RepID=UPI003C2F3E84
MIRPLPLLSAVALALFVAACGGGGSSGGGGVVVTPTPTPTTTATPPPTPTSSSSPLPTTWAGVSGYYDVQPDIGACRAGTLKAAVKAEFLARLNEIRARHNLPAVVYSSDEDVQQAESSLMMAANIALSHTPPTNWRCYTSDGATAAGASNLIGGWGTGLGFDSEDDLLAGWLREGGTASLGHRRWILHPFLRKTSYGRVSGLLPDGRRATTASMRVFNFVSAGPAPAAVPPFVGFPQGDYPSRYFALTDYLSFSVIPSSTNNGADRLVDFSAATVSVRGPSGELPITNITRDNDGYGIANNIQWRVTGLAANTSYTVTIAGVRSAPQATYTYNFRIVP